MEMLEKRLQRVHSNEERERSMRAGFTALQQQQQQASTAASVAATGRSAAAVSSSADGNLSSPRGQFQLPTRGLYGADSARGLQIPSGLPPIQGATTGSKAAAAPSPRGGGAPTDFDHLFASAQLTPRDKYPIPQTSMQEIGWWNKPLVTHREMDKRFQYGLSQSELTRNGSQFVGSRRK